jgi:hypothetical protein
MDILNVIKLKLKRSKYFADSNGLNAVVIHIEVAENYLNRAKNEDDPNLYTDIIYRTNHAFEGILKEAYSIFAKKDPSIKTPNEIEKYFSENSILKSRVSDLFKNYRQEWRNPSTHDYKLFFSEQESFLAIVTVSAFVSILLDQMLEKLSSDEEIRATSSKIDEIKSNLENYKDTPLWDKCVTLLVQFGMEFNKTDIDSEYQYLGMITGFINSLEPDFKIETEPLFKNNKSQGRPDIVISHGNESVVIETKRYMKSMNIKAAEAQLLEYLRIGKIKYGILYQTPLKSKQLYSIQKITCADDVNDYVLIELFAK